MNAIFFIVLTIGQPLVSLPLPPGTLAELPQPPGAVMTYADYEALARKQNVRLAVFIGVPARKINGVVTVQVPHLDYWKRWGKGTVTVYREGDLILIGNVVATVTDSEIRSGNKKVVSQEAFFFGLNKIVQRDDRPAGGSYRQGHVCEVCGKTVTAISGRGPVPGTHRHDCQCGNSWWH